MTMRRGWRPALQQSRALSTANPLKLPVRIRHRADQIAREADQPDLPPPLQPLGAQDRANLVETAFDMNVDQPIVIAVPVADPVRGALHPRADHFDAVGVSTSQVPVEFLHPRTRA